MDSITAYQALRQPRHETLRIRGLDMHLTRWGPYPSPAEPPLFLLHGWLDAGETFQFVVDAFKKDRPIVAPDWRGFGRSEWPQEGYGFPDYLGDFDALMDHLSPDAPARIVGHSMGGNIANLYAGLRPERVRCVVNLEGLGLPRTSPQDAPKRMRKWLDQIKSPTLEKSYNSFEQLASVIGFRYQRFPPGVAQFVARVWGISDGDKGVRLAADPRHHWVNPILYKREDAEATWREIRAPLLMALGEASDYMTRLGADGTMEALRAAFPDAELAVIADAGHMLHIERPDAVAAMIEAFLDAH
ncbi:MAG TPA: alpha/beta hydrolase [Steroidobacteraceae bacterium]|nr:alpha/beta hydrolase [Steroidobacteraceae bacterium]